MGRTKQTGKKDNSLNKTHVKRVFAHPFQKTVDLGTKTFQGIKIIKKIGRGAFGRVYKGLREDGKVCAVKFVDLMDDETNANFFLEFELQNLLSHEDVGPKIIGYWEIPEHNLAVVATECWSTTLEKYLQEKNLTKPNKFIATKLEEKVKKMHQTGHVHLDLHAGNILLQVDERSHVTDVSLTDFGKATHYKGIDQSQLHDAIKHYKLKRTTDPRKLDWQMVEKIKKGEL